jgi:hypothetical protein
MDFAALSVETKRANDAAWEAVWLYLATTLVA